MKRDFLPSHCGKLARVDERGFRFRLPARFMEDRSQREITSGLLRLAVNGDALSCARVVALAAFQLDAGNTGMGTRIVKIKPRRVPERNQRACGVTSFFPQSTESQPGIEMPPTVGGVTLDDRKAIWVSQRRLILGKFPSLGKANASLL